MAAAAPPHKRQRGVSLNGPAHVCYIAMDDTEDNHAFQGHLVDTATRMCYGLMATQIERKNPLDCCCQADDPPLWFKLTIIDFQNKKETNRIVEKTGGDYIILSSAQITFTTTSLKTGTQAEQRIFSIHNSGVLESVIQRATEFFNIEDMRKYNPKLLQFGDAIVCVGGILQAYSAVQHLKSITRSLRTIDMIIKELDFEDEGEDSENLVCSHHHEETLQLNHKRQKDKHGNEEEHHQHQDSKATEQITATTHNSELSNNHDDIPTNSPSSTKPQLSTNATGTTEQLDDNDDDFGFEEYKNVKLIKVPLKDEATEKSDA